MGTPFSFFRHLVMGRSIALVLDGVFQMDEIKKLGISVNDLITMLRIKGCNLHEAALFVWRPMAIILLLKKRRGKNLLF